MSAAPYLTVEERVTYLCEKGYASEVSDDVTRYLARVNFHYFLGYARNFRKLVNEGRVSGDTSLDRLLRIIDLDRELSVLSFDALRRFEWRLRAAYVERHCELFAPTGCYVDEAHYVRPNPDLPTVPACIRKHSLQTREPYVVEHLSRGLPAGKALRQMEDHELIARLRTLPVWASVDTWSMGTLGRAICQARGPELEDEAERVWLWRLVAADLGIANPLFMGQIESLSIFRNLIAHHSRLWMRPPAKPPKIPKAIKNKDKQGVATQSMFACVLALAGALQGSGDESAYLDEAKRIVGEDSAFEAGVKKPVRDK